jgi:hypothetical protein
MGSRVVSFAAIELLRPQPAARTAETVGGVTIFGRNALQHCDGPQTGFIQAWRDAMCFELGSEEFEKLCLARRR